MDTSDRTSVLQSQSTFSSDRRNQILDQREQALLQRGQSGAKDIKTEIVVDQGQPQSADNLFQSMADNCGPGTNQYTILSGGVKWRSFPVTYAIDITGSGVDSLAARNAVIKAFTEFDNQYPAQFFALSNDFSTAKIKVQWKQIDGALNTIGYTSYSYKVSSKELISATITFDRRDKWLVSAVERCGSFGNALDIQNVATHELGHAVGLGHVSDRLQSMYSTSFKGETLKRTLGNGDKRGFDFLY